MALTIEQFRAEVDDKLSVVFNSCHSTPLSRAINRQQCEDFLVERYTEVAQDNERLKAQEPRSQSINQATIMWLQMLSRGSNGPMPQHHAINLLVALEAEIERLNTGWQPIETAPKDGTRILLARKQVMSGKWIVLTAYWNSGDAFSPPTWSAPFNMHGATFWMPLPDPPSA